MSEQLTDCSTEAMSLKLFGTANLQNILESAKIFHNFFKKDRQRIAAAPVIVKVHFSMRLHLSKSLADWHNK